MPTPNHLAADAAPSLEPDSILVRVSPRADGQYEVRTDFHVTFAGGWAGVAQVLNTAYQTAVRQALLEELDAPPPPPARRLYLPGGPHG